MQVESLGTAPTHNSFRTLTSERQFYADLRALSRRGPPVSSRVATANVVTERSGVTEVQIRSHASHAWLCHVKSAGSPAIFEAASPPRTMQVESLGTAPTHNSFRTLTSERALVAVRRRREPSGALTLSGNASPTNSSGETPPSEIGPTGRPARPRRDTTATAAGHTAVPPEASSVRHRLGPRPLGTFASVRRRRSADGRVSLRGGRGRSAEVRRRTSRRPIPDSRRRSRRGSRSLTTFSLTGE